MCRSHLLQSCCRLESAANIALFKEYDAWCTKTSNLLLARADRGPLLHQALTVLGLDLLGGAALGASDTTICTPRRAHTSVRTGSQHTSAHAVIGNYRESQQSLGTARCPLQGLSEAVSAHSCTDCWRCGAPALARLDGSQHKTFRACAKERGPERRAPRAPRP